MLGTGILYWKPCRLSRSNGRERVIEVDQGPYTRSAQGGEGRRPLRAGSHGDAPGVDPGERVGGHKGLPRGTTDRAPPQGPKERGKYNGPAVACRGPRTRGNAPAGRGHTMAGVATGEGVEARGPVDARCAGV